MSNQKDQTHFTAIKLLDHDFKYQTPIIAKGIWPAGGHILIAGDTGVGKSLLRLEMALDLINGTPWLGFEVGKEYRVAIFQYENTEYMEQKRLKKMCWGMGINYRDEHGPLSLLTFGNRKLRPNLSLKTERKRFMDQVKSTECEIAFYDCLSNLHTANENETMKIREILDVLSDINAELGISCCVIDHFGKEQTGNNKRRKIDMVRGARSKVDWAVSAMTYDARYDRSRILRQIDFVKVRDAAQLKPLLLERDENFLHAITFEDTLCPPDEVKRILREKLDGYASSSRVLNREIQKEIGCSERSAFNFIKRAVEMKSIKRMSRGQGKKVTYEL